MDHTEHTAGRGYADEESAAPISVSHFVHTLKAYRGAILLSLAAVALAYFVISIMFYLTSPSQRITTQRFLVDFEGAAKGRYPNATRFSIADVVSGPILQRVYHDNKLDDLIGFSDFTKSVFVLESNAASDLLAAEYQARLADPKLTPVDRERIQNDYELKRQSINKNEYSINFVRRGGLRKVPEAIARKVLLDTLNVWADFAVNQQHVLSYRIAVLSPAILKPNAIELSDPIAAIDVLRGKANSVISSIMEIEGLPGGNLVRSQGDQLSLPEVRLRLEEIIRFRLEPLVTFAMRSGITDTASTIRFFETQLAYDTRRLQGQRATADSYRDALAVYEQQTSTRMQQQTSIAPQKATSGETVMPQLSDSFLDRLLALTSRSADLEYRQALADKYRDALTRTIPFEQAVAYETDLLRQLRSIAPAATRSDATAVRAQIDEARAEMGRLIEKSNELYRLISRNMTPSTQLFTLTSPPTTRTVRSYDLSRLMMYGFVIVFLALPVIIIACLLHNRVREEETAQGYVNPDSA